MSKKKKKKKRTMSPFRQPSTTRSGGITTYYRKGKECQCASKRPAGSTEERDRRHANRSARQQLLMNVFTLVCRLMKTLLRKLADVNSWVSFAKDTPMSAANLCHKVNASACGEHGVENFRAFMFSVGWLAVPLYTRVCRDAWTFTLEWRRHGILDEARDGDTLIMGYFYDCLPDAPRVLYLPAVTRGDGTATFTLPDPAGPGGEPLSPETVVHIYLISSARTWRSTLVPSICALRRGRRRCWGREGSPRECFYDTVMKE